MWQEEAFNKFIEHRGDSHGLNNSDKEDLKNAFSP